MKDCVLTSSSRLANWLRDSGTHGPPFHGCGLYRFQNWVVRAEHASHHRSHKAWPAWNDSFTLPNGSFHTLSWDNECCTNTPNALAASGQRAVSLHHQSTNQSKHICIAPYVVNESEAHDGAFKAIYSNIGLISQIPGLFYAFFLCFSFF